MFSRVLAKGRIKITKTGRLQYATRERIGQWKNGHWALSRATPRYTALHRAMKKLSLSNEAFGSRSLINWIERALIIWHKVSIYSIKYKEHISMLCSGQMTGHVSYQSQINPVSIPLH